MPETNDPSLDLIGPKTGGDDGPPASIASTTKASSFLGLALVSALNLACLIFIGYHFANHPDEAILTDSTKVETIELRPGNLDLAPATGLVLTIASHVKSADVGHNKANGERADIGHANSDPVSLASAAPPTLHWVQLGALSKHAMAQQYWTRLKKQHKMLLGDMQPTIFGPDQVSGSLYHIRLGPLDAGDAEDFCNKLQAEGSDCFCLPSAAQKPGRASTRQAEPYQYQSHKP